VDYNYGPKVFVLSNKLKYLNLACLEADHLFSVLNGEEVASRREFIEKCEITLNTTPNKGPFESRPLYFFISQCYHTDIRL